MLGLNVATYLCDRVIHVHGRDAEFARLGELVQAVDAGHTLLNEAFHHVEQGRVALQHQVSRVTTVIQNLEALID